MFNISDFDADLVSRITDRVLDYEPLADRTNVEMFITTTHALHPLPLVALLEHGH